MAEPFFSVMMPAYNAERYIALALDSILAQTFNDFELIVFDDFSKDRTYEIIKKYEAKDKRIKSFRNEKNMGNCYTRRLALNEMTGRYVAFLDSDDIWESKKLEKFARRLETAEKDSVCVHSDAILIDADGCEMGQSFQQKFNTNNKPVEGNIFHEILLTNWINMSSAVVDRKTLLEVGGFRPISEMVADDWDMWVRFARNAKFYFIPEKLTRYRIHEAGISSAHRVERVAIAREQIFDNVLKLYSHKLPRKILSKVCYLRAANAVVLGFSWQARKYFFESWVSNKFNIKALIRVIFGC